MKKKTVILSLAIVSITSVFVWYFGFYRPRRIQIQEMAESLAKQSDELYKYIFISDDNVISICQKEIIKSKDISDNIKGIYICKCTVPLIRAGVADQYLNTGSKTRQEFEQIIKNLKTHNKAVIKLAISSCKTEQEMIGVAGQKEMYK